MTIKPWPVHPKPIEDELFTSWIFRASQGNGTKYFSLCYLTSPDYKAILSSPLDHVASEALAESYARRLKISADRAYQTTLSSYESILFEQKSRSAHKTGILNPGTQLNHKQRYSLQFCPTCFQEEPVYYRKQWKVTFITVCTKHGVKLQDRCPVCQLPIVPYKNDTKHKKLPFQGSLTQCYACGFDLKESSPEQAGEAVLADTVLYESILKNGFYALPDAAWVYSFSFFSVLKHLMRVVIENRREECKEEYQIDVDCLSHHLRYVSLCELSGVFQRWPQSFITWSTKEKVQYSSITSMTKQINGIPYWFDSVARQVIYNPNIEPSEASVLCAIKHMRNIRKRLSLLGLNKMMGYRDSGVIRRVFNDYKSKANA